MDNLEPQDSSENEYRKRILRLEELAESTYGKDPVQYSLVIDELGIPPKDKDYYCQGIRMRRELSDVAVHEEKMRLFRAATSPTELRKLDKERALELEREHQKRLRVSEQTKSEERGIAHKRESYRRKLPYTLQQHKLDEEIIGYMLMKRPKLESYNQALAFLERFKPVLKIEGGKPVPLKECSPSRIIAAAVDMYETAQKRLKEYKDDVREIVNGVHQSAGYE